MAGLYIHIPFCRKACHYCDFHFSTNLSRRKEMIASIRMELELKSKRFEHETVETIYFGGGTPSILSPEELDLLTRTINDRYQLTETPEFTMEVNPEDVTPSLLASFRSMGVNRLSIGLQSFNDSVLSMLNRNHKSATSWRAIDVAKKSGLDNISVDLIFGIPGDNWMENLDRVADMGVPHISVYGLTIEPKTVLGRWYRAGKFHPVPETEQAEQFQTTHEQLTALGYDHYEVSNYSLPSSRSRHNTAYWQSRPYLGFGPSAHSFIGTSRWQNVRNNASFIKALAEGLLPEEHEHLNLTQRANEYIMLRTRTKLGLDTEYFRSSFQRNIMSDRAREIDDLFSRKLMKEVGATLITTDAGFLLADEIALKLFYDE